MIEIKTAQLNGKRVAYSSNCEFLVQVGVGKKGAYKTRHRFVGDLGKAVLYYNRVNVFNGLKKRLIAPAFNRPLLDRQFS